MLRNKDKTQLLTQPQVASGLGARLKKIFGGDNTQVEQLHKLEEFLLTADVGIEASSQLLTAIGKVLKKKKKIERSDLERIFSDKLKVLEAPLEIQDDKLPFVIMAVGVNGSGKTTSIVKLANYYRQRGLKPMIAAGDTFRAAAVEQLCVWGDKNQVPVIKQGRNADSAAVIFDAMIAARSRGYDLLLADTAGRMHNNTDLMEQLSKIIRVLAKKDSSAPHEILMAIDGTSGQNVLSQVAEFWARVCPSGLILNKVDGSSKAGIVFALAEKYQIPVRFLGVGESDTDLEEFKTSNFVQRLLQGMD